MSIMNRRNSIGEWSRSCTRELPYSVAPQPMTAKSQAEKEPDIQIINDGPWVVFSLDQVQGGSAC